MCKEEDDIPFKAEEAVVGEQEKKEENKYRGYPDPGQPPVPPPDLVDLPTHSAGSKLDNLNLKASLEIVDLDLSDMSTKAQ